MFAMTLQPPPVLASERRWMVSFVFASLTKWHHHIIIVLGGYANRICIQPKPSSSSSSSSRERETRCDEYSATRCCCSCSLLPKLLPFFDAKSDATTRMVFQRFSLTRRKRNPKLGDEP